MEEYLSRHQPKTQNKTNKKQTLMIPYSLSVVIKASESPETPNMSEKTLFSRNLHCSYKTKSTGIHPVWNGCRSSIMCRWCLHLFRTLGLFQINSIEQFYVCFVVVVSQVELVEWMLKCWKAVKLRNVLRVANDWIFIFWQTVPLSTERKQMYFCTLRSWRHVLVRLFRTIFCYSV